MSVSASRCFIVTAVVAFALVVTATGQARPGFAVNGLKITPPVGAFGGVKAPPPCDLSTLAGCTVRTFTFTNVGSEPILFNSMGIANPADFAFGVTTAGTDCDALPIVSDSWSLAPGVSCTITVVFEPQDPGHFENELRLSHDSDPVAVVPLSGVGL